jgi:hypothetical protein
MFIQLGSLAPLDRLVLIFDLMPSFMRSLTVEIGFLIIFEMEAKLRIGLEA